MMRSLFGKIRQNEFVKNILTLTTGTAVAQALPLLMAPVLTRLYTPQEFGRLAFFISLTTLLAVPATGRYEMAVVLPESARRARRLVKLALLLALLFSVCLGLPVFFFGDYLQSSSAFRELGRWIYLLPLSVLLFSVFEILRYYSIRKKEYQAVSGALIARSGMDAGLQAFSGLQGWKSGGLLLAYIASLCSGQIRIWITFLRDLKRSREPLFSIRGLGHVARRYRRFPRFALPAHFLNTASLQLPVFVLSAFFAAGVTGFYTLAQRALNAPMSILGNAVGQVFFQKISEEKGNEAAVRTLTWKLYRSLLLLGVVPLISILVFGEELFGFVFGAAWAEAGAYARALSVWVLFVFISSPLSHVLFVREKQKQALVLQAVIFTSRLAILGVCVLAGWSAYRTVLLFGITGAVLFFFFILYLLALLGIPRLRVLAFTIAVLLAAAAPLYLLKFFLCG